MSYQRVSRKTHTFEQWFNAFQSMLVTRYGWDQKTADNVESDDGDFLLHYENGLTPAMAYKEESQYFENR